MKIVSCGCAQCRYARHTRGGKKTARLQVRALRRTARQAVKLGYDVATVASVGYPG